MSKARGSYRVDPLGHKKKSPVLLNGLTEAETNATASVMGLVEQKVLEHAPCLGMNCGITRTDQMHSAECQAEHAATIAGGKFVKPAQPQQEPVGALILGGVVDTSDGPEYEEWDIEWNHKAIESLQERLVTCNPVTLNIYTSPPTQQQQKPVTDKENEKFRRDVSNFAGADPEATKYALEEFLKNRTSPPAQRKPWVGLTDDEIRKEFHPLHDTGLQFARAIEAKLKEKNT